MTNTTLIKLQEITGNQDPGPGPWKASHKGEPITIEYVLDRGLKIVVTNTFPSFDHLAKPK